MNLLLPLNSRVLVKVDTTYRDNYKLTDSIEIKIIHKVWQ
jgi:hypothetical protein